MLFPLAALLMLGPAAPGPQGERNPAVEACQGKNEGEACMLEELVKTPDSPATQRRKIPGACRPDECCTLDYSKGSPPQTVCGPCLACKSGPADGKPPPEKADAAVEAPRADDGDPPAQSPNEKRGCAVGGSGVPAWAALGLVLAWRRRPRR